MRIITKSGQIMIVATPKKTQQGDGKNTKFSARSNSSRRKPSRGQGR